MLVKFNIAGTAFEVETDAQARDDVGGELLGDCLFRFADELACDLSEVTLEEYILNGTAYRATLAARQEDRTGVPWRSGDDLELDADAGIAAMAYLIDLGNEDDEPWRFRWDGSGSVFWLFHDLTHAIEDFSADAGGQHAHGPSQQLTAFEEDRANLEGAKLALDAGVDAGEICNQLAGLAKAFRIRFREDSTALSDLLKSGALSGGEFTAQAYTEHVACFARDCAEAFEDEPDDCDGFEYTPETDSSFPAWAVLLYSDNRRAGECMGDDEQSLGASAYWALNYDITEQARDLLTCVDCGDHKKIEDSLCVDCSAG